MSASFTWLAAVGAATQSTSGRSAKPDRFATVRERMTSFYSGPPLGAPFPLVLTTDGRRGPVRHRVSHASLYGFSLVSAMSLRTSECVDSRLP